MPPLTYTDAQFLRAVAEKPASSTGDIARLVGCKTRNANIRLTRLFEVGRVNRDMISDRYFWSAVRTG